MPTDFTNRFYELALSEKLYPNLSNLKFHLDYLFNKVEIKNKKVLDVGGGWGLLTFYAAVSGAKKAVCLEPESDGSTAGITSRFNSVKATLSDSLPATLLQQTIQEFTKSSDEKFDVIIMHNSINHLNEPACINLLKDEESYNAYKAIFTDVYNKLNPGGILLITDCGSKNFWNDLGMKCFLAPTIEWHIHQQPKTWINLLSKIGFSHPHVAWRSPNSFGKMGKIFMGNALASYLTISRFKLTMQKGH